MILTGYCIQNKNHCGISIILPKQLVIKHEYNINSLVNGIFSTVLF